MAGKPATARIAAAFIAPLLCTLGVLGGIGSFTTIRHLANPWFGTLAWIIPVGIDLGIAALLARTAPTTRAAIPIQRRIVFCCSGRAALRSGPACHPT
jgi:hypothetical protein